MITSLYFHPCHSRAGDQEVVVLLVAVRAQNYQLIHGK